MQNKFSSTEKSHPDVGLRAAGFRLGTIFGLLRGLRLLLLGILPPERRRPLLLLQELLERLRLLLQELPKTTFFFFPATCSKCNNKK